MEQKAGKAAWQRGYNRIVKRALDLCLSVVFILVFWPLYLILALLVKLDDPAGPVLFKQDRLGRNGTVYKMYKFRTMYHNTEHTGSGVYSDGSDSRVTKIGRILRATSLDELPQLFNVIRGECSLIGFRSPLTYHPWPWEQYTEEQKKMFVMRPGLTGWAQVHGRRTVEWNKRIAMNVWYAENVSFLLDCKILWLTIATVFSGRDNENKGKTV